MQTGMIPGIVLQIVCAVVSIYTLYLLLILYLHRKSELVRLLGVHALVDSEHRDHETTVAYQV